MDRVSDQLKTQLYYIKAPERSVEGDNDGIQEMVSEVLADVKLHGDAAVRNYALKFDKSELMDFEVSAQQRKDALASMDPQTRADTEFAIANVSKFAKAQMETMLPLEFEIHPGIHLGHRIIPIERVGCYVPGGRYPLLSAPIMGIVPAKIAGCAEVIACLPPNAHPSMIAGCHLAGADRIFRIGGAQAIAAMAYGTETVPSVDKIVGPGNAFVNEAKRQVFGPLGIDQLAGPSEIFIVADETANPVTVAADLLAQAEHDIRTRVGLITSDRKLAEDTLVEVEKQLRNLSTAETAGQAWRDYGEIVLCESEQSMLEYSDIIAPEHLEVHTRDAKATGEKLRHYGSLFIGENASVVFSDKCCGTNHTLPTMGAARYTGGLWVGSYVKVCTHQWIEDEGVATVALPAGRQSATEKMEGHRRAAMIRMDGKVVLE